MQLEPVVSVSVKFKVKGTHLLHERYAVYTSKQPQVSQTKDSEKTITNPYYSRTTTFAVNQLPSAIPPRSSTHLLVKVDEVVRRVVSSSLCSVYKNRNLSIKKFSEQSQRKTSKETRLEPPRKAVSSIIATFAVNGYPLYSVNSHTPIHARRRGSG